MSFRRLYSNIDLPMAPLTGMFIVLMLAQFFSFQESRVALAVLGLAVGLLLLVWAMRRYPLPRRMWLIVTMALIVTLTLMETRLWFVTLSAVIWWWIGVVIIMVVSSWASFRGTVEFTALAVLLGQTILAISGAITFLQLHQRASGFATNANGLGAALLWGVLICAALLLGRKQQRWGTVMIFLLLGVVFLSTISLTAFVALLIPAGWLVWSFRRSILWRRTLISLGIVVVLGAAAWLTRPAAVHRLITTQHIDISFHQRVEFNRVAIAMWKQKPWFGWGLGTYQKVFPRFTHQFLEQPLYAHNLYPQLLAETGLVGALGWLAVVIMIGRAGWKWMQRQTEPVMQALSRGLWAGWLAFTLAAALDFGWFFVAGWVLWCVASGIFLSQENTNKIVLAPIWTRAIAAIMALGGLIVFGFTAQAERANWQANQEYALARTDQTRVSLEQALRYGAGPDVAVFYAQNLWSDRRSGDLATARRLITKELQRNPDDDHLHNMLGIIENADKNFPIAIAEFRQARTLNPWFHPSYYVNEARAMKNAGDRVGALRLVNATIARYGAHPLNGNPTMATEYPVLLTLKQQLQ